MRMRPFLLLVALLLTTGCASRETLTPAYAPLSLVVGFPACAEQADNGDCTLFEVRRNNFHGGIGPLTGCSA